MTTRIEKIKNWVLSNPMLFVVGIIGIVSMFFSFIFLGEMFVGMDDYQKQHILFYQEYKNLLKEGLPFWSMNFMGGLNFWASKAYYLIGDVYAYIVLLFPDEFILKGMFCALVLKITVSYLGFYWLMRKYWNRQDLTSALFALLYAFSGWNVIFTMHPVYTSFYSLVPFVLIGIEAFLQNRKYLFFIGACALAMFCNYYLFYTMSAFMPVYVIGRSLQLDLNLKKKNYWLLIGKLIFFYFIGVLSASVLVLPSVLFLMQSERAALEITRYPINVFVMQLYSLLTPMIQDFGGMYKLNEYALNQIGLYQGVISLLLLFQIPALEKKNRKIAYGALLFSIIILAFPIFATIFHLVPSLRFTFIISILILLIASEVFETSVSSKSVLFAEALVLLVYLVVRFICPQFVMNEYRGTIIVNPFELFQMDKAALFSVIYCICLLMKSKIKWVNCLIAALVLIELNVSVKPLIRNVLTGKSDPIVAPAFDKDSDLYEAMNEVEAYVQDPQRVAVLESVYSFANEYVMNNVMGTSIYDTYYQFYATDHYEIMDLYPGIHWFIYLTDPSFAELYNVHYILANKNETVMGEGFLDMTKLNFIWENDTYALYQVIDVPSFAFTAYSTSSWKEWKEYKDGKYFHEVVTYLKHSPIVDDENNLFRLSEQESLSLDPTQFSNTYLRFDFYQESESILCLSLNYDPGWSAFVNGEKTEVFRINGGMMGIHLADGNQTVELKFVPLGLKTGIMVTSVSLLIYGILFLQHFTNRREKNIIKKKG